MIDSRNNRRIDANPFHWALPAEVTSRRRPAVKRDAKKSDHNEVKIDIETALSLKPETRIKWLTTALDMVKEGRADSQELFAIISSKSFSAKVPLKVGQKLCSLAQDSSFLFSEKQERHILSRDFALNAKYGPEPTREAERDEEIESDRESPRRRERSRGRKEPADDLQDRRRRKGERQEERSRSISKDRRPEKNVRKRMRTRPESEERSHRDTQERSEEEDKEKETRVQSRPEAQSGSPQAGFQEVRAKLGRAQLEQQERSRKQKQKEEEEAENRRQKEEEEADSSLQLLASLTKPQHRSTGHGQSATGHSNRRRTMSCSRSPVLQRRVRRDADRYPRQQRRRSRSRSLSIQAARISPSRSASPKNQKASFDDALQRRMAQRAEADTSRTAVVWSQEDLRSGRHKSSRLKWLDKYQNKGFQM
eukprot:TRINITY_DN42617_c0_g1_i1.p1 TRINITY_DN42617_c0_g1~~TRINITY_DN42617_c0_g1_i1.p1  ORF type:complete len:423 (-),score=63.67 TRINITY_DN42617_c0_g1_i1:465-1733(-)